MLLFPNAKINIGLNILNKRTDGYHNIETIMVPINLKDSLEFIPSKIFKFTTSGFKLDIAPENNICTKVYNILKAKYKLQALLFHLHKAIPSGAGLGGSSADASFLLKALNNYFKLSITNSELKNIASDLGSDCPFFIDNKPCIATSKGEILESINLDLTNYKLIVIYPQIHVNTAWAYKNSKPQNKKNNLRNIVKSEPITNWRKFITNDFEETVFNFYPEIKEIINKLYESGAIFASMTGSGSASYGIFEKNKKNKKFIIPKNAVKFESCFLKTIL